RQLINLEFFRLRVIAQPSAVRTTVDEPQLTLRRARDSVQAIGWRLPGGGGNLGIRKWFGGEAAQLSAPPLGYPALSLPTNRYLVWFRLVVRQFKFHSYVFSGVAFEQSPGQTAIRIRRRFASPSDAGEIR